MSLPTPADIERLLPPLLRPYCPEGTYVGRKTPATRRDYMVTVRRQGGPTKRFTDYPRVGINLWAPTPEAANDLASTLTRALHELAGRGDNPLKTVNVYGQVEVPDDSGLQQRYFTVDMSVRTA